MALEYVDLGGVTCACCLSPQEGLSLEPCGSVKRRAELTLSVDNTSFKGTLPSRSQKLLYGSPALSMAHGSAYPTRPSTIQRGGGT